MRHETMGRGSGLTRVRPGTPGTRSCLIVLTVALVAAPTLVWAQDRAASTVGIASTSDEYGHAIEDARAIVREVMAESGIPESDPLLFEPGTQYSYSSYGWNLLSAVVEGASGRGFLSLMRDSVFEPLEMRHSLAGYTDSIISHCTSFYERNGARTVLNAPYVDNSYKWAGGGFLSTPEDLIRFGSAHLEPRFLEAETLETLFMSQRLSDGEMTDYGIGWRTLTDEDEHHVVSHGGGSVGGTAMLIVNRDTGLVVAAVGNLSGGPIAGMARRIVVVFSR